MHGNYFSHKYSTFSQQVATTLLQKAFTNIANQQGLPGVLCCWPLGLVLCIFLYITCAMIGRNITNHCVEKKKELCFNLDHFVLKVKPKKNFANLMNWDFKNFCLKILCNLRNLCISQDFLCVMDLFSLYILFSHFRPRDATLGNSFFQRSSYAHARINYEETKGKFP